MVDEMHLMMSVGSTLRTAAWIVGWALAISTAIAAAPPEPVETELAAARGRERLGLLNRLAAQKVEKDPLKASRLAEEALVLARRLDDREAEATAVYLLADAARVQGDHRLALERFQTARQLFAALGNQPELGRSLRRIGDLYYFLGDYELALQRYLEALQHFERLARDDPRGKGPLHLAHLQAAIGNVLRASGDSAGAQQYYEKALAAYERLGFAAGASGATYNLGLIQQDLKKYQEAIRYFERSRDAAIALGDDYLLSLAVGSAGSAHLELGQLDRADELIRQALAQCEKAQRHRGILANLANLARVQHLQGRSADALKTLDRALALAVKLGDRRIEADIHEEKAAIQERVGDYRAALSSFRTYQALNQELVGAEKASRLNKLRIVHETGKKEQEIALLTAGRELERLVRWTVIGALLFSFVFLGLLFSRYRLRVRTAREIDAKNVELQAAYARVEELSRTDELTGLLNRRAVLEIVALERARCERSGETFALVLADVDDFKRCNDQWGHACGDEVLRELARLVRSAVRTTDTVGRWGGEEFLLVLPATDEDGASQVAEKIRSLVAGSPIPWEGREITLTMTLGVAIESSGDIETALRRADDALYTGKRRGKNRVEMAA
jgi:diguanylate cyclase (GGDEF)-like protein